MSSLNELAIEYKELAARVAYKISQHEKAQDAQGYEIVTLREMLRDARAMYRACSDYYTMPRDGEFDISNWTAPRRSSKYAHDD